MTDVIERGRPEMTPLLEGLAQSTRRLREAGVDDDARGGDAVAPAVPAKPEDRA